MLDTINQICDTMTIDLRFVLCSNFLLMFIFKGSKLSGSIKKWISVAIMLFMATVCWFFFDASAEKLFWSIPVAMIAYDLFIKPAWKYVYKKYLAKSDHKNEENDDIDNLNSVG